MGGDVGVFVAVVDGLIVLVFVLSGRERDSTTRSRRSRA